VYTHYQATTCPQFSQPEPKIVCREQEVEHVSDEKLSKMLPKYEELAPEDHPNYPGDDEEPYVMGREGLHFVHLPHEPELRKQGHRFHVHSEGHEDLHANPILTRMKKKG